MIIDELFDAWKDAVARSDAPRLAELVAEDGEFWSHGAPAVQGRAAVLALFTGFFDQYELRQEFEEVERIVAGDVAFIRGMETNVVTPRAGGDAMTVRQRAFMLLRRDAAGDWHYARGMTNLESR